MNQFKINNKHFQPISLSSSSPPPGTEAWVGGWGLDGRRPSEVSSLPFFLVKSEFEFTFIFVLKDSTRIMVRMSRWHQTFDEFFELNIQNMYRKESLFSTHVNHGYYVQPTNILVSMANIWRTSGSNIWVATKQSRSSIPANGSSSTTRSHSQMAVLLFHRPQPFYFDQPHPRQFYTDQPYCRGAFVLNWQTK